MKHFFAFAFAACLFVSSLSAQTFFPLPALNGSVKAFAAYGDTLYIAGNFTTVGAANRNGLAAIDLATGLATSWDPNITNNGAAASASGIAVSADGSTIYFCGNFDKVGSTARNYLAAVSDTGVLQSLSATFNDQVIAVRELDGKVFIIGNFTMVNATAHVGFAGFDADGTLNGFNPGLAAFNTGASFRGVTFSSDGTKMYVALGNSQFDGTDTDGNAVTRRGFVSLRLTDGRETKFRPSIKDVGNDGGTFAVATEGEAFYVGGPFDMVETVGVNRFARFNNEVFDAAFSPATGTGPDGSVRSIAADGNAVYLAGDFANVGATARVGLVALDGVTGAVKADWDAQSSVKLSNADTVIFHHGGIVFIGGSSLDNGSMLLGQNIQYYGALTGVPTPVVVTNTPPATPPTIAISGKKKITTTKAKLKIKGTATGGVTSVTYTVGKAKGSAAGTSAWSFTAKLKPGKNAVAVIAHGPGGDSAPVKLTVTRK